MNFSGSNDFPNNSIHNLQQNVSEMEGNSTMIAGLEAEANQILERQGQDLHLAQTDNNSVFMNSTENFHHMNQIN